MRAPGKTRPSLGPTLALGASLLLALPACVPARYQPRPIDHRLTLPTGASSLRAPGAKAATSTTTDLRTPVASTPETSTGREAPTDQPRERIGLAQVIRSVTTRYPLYLAKLLERDLASGRLQSAMGRFDTQLAAKVGGRLQGYYESTVAQAGVEQPLATGDTIYGGYRITDGFLPDYYSDRTQDDGRLFFGGRFPLLRDRSIDSRRAGVRKAEIDVELAEPKILAARIGYVQKATAIYCKWAAAGRKLVIARELMALAEQRQAGLQRAVEQQFLAEIALTDNERLIAQRRIYVTRAERAFQTAALELSLFLRDDADAPIIAVEGNLPEQLPQLPRVERPLADDLADAARRRPDLAALQLEVDKARTDRDLADNQTLPNLDVVVDVATPLNDGPYSDREDLELFVGGELKLPIQRRDARGKLLQAETRLNALLLQQQYQRDRITNELLDARSAIDAAERQLADTQRNVELAEQLVTAEQRAFDLGRSDLLRVQLREAQLADARVLAIDAQLTVLLATADYRAALGYAGE